MRKINISIISSIVILLLSSCSVGDRNQGIISPDANKMITPTTPFLENSDIITTADLPQNNLDFNNFILIESVYEGFSLLPDKNSGVINLVDLIFPLPGYDIKLWNPDNQSIYYSPLAKINILTREFTEIPIVLNGNDITKENHWEYWDISKDQIIFVEKGKKEGEEKFVINYDLFNNILLYQIMVPSDYYFEGVSYDGQLLVFQQINKIPSSGNIPEDFNFSDLFVYNVETTNWMQITNDTVFEFDISWGENTNKLLVISGEYGYFEDHAPARGEKISVYDGESGEKIFEELAFDQVEKVGKADRITLFSDTLFINKDQDLLFNLITKSEQGYETRLCIINLLSRTIDCPDFGLDGLNARDLANYEDKVMAFVYDISDESVCYKLSELKIETAEVINLSNLCLINTHFTHK